MLRAQRVVALAALVLLGGGGTGAFVLIEKLKVEAPLLIDVDYRGARFFAPLCGGPTCNQAARFSFVLPHRTPIVVEIVGGSPTRVVRTLLRSPARKGAVHLAWNGRTGTGALAPDGSYLVRIAFAAYRTTKTIMIPIVLDDTPPRITIRAARGTVIAPGRGRYPVQVAVSEPARVRLRAYGILADGTAPLLWQLRRAVAPGAVPIWRGVVGGMNGSPLVPAPAGTYVLGVRAVDRAGNVSELPQTLAAGALGDAPVVRVRTVDLAASGRVLTPAPLAALVRRRIVRGFPGDFDRRVAAAPATLRLRTPHAAGLWVLAASALAATSWGVQAAPGRAGIVVVVPTYSWQAGNDYDADDDGIPDAPPVPQRLDRPLADGGLADVRGLARTLAPLLATGRPFGAISDAALDTGGVPASARLLVVAAEHAWTIGLATRLASFQAAGGRVLLLSSPLMTQIDRAGGAIVDRGVRAAAPLPGRGLFHALGPALRGLR